MKYRIERVFVACVLIMACVPGLALETLTVRLNWIPNQADHTFYFVAIERGYYQEAGLEVTVERGSGSLDAVNLVAARKIDIGVADVSTALAARGEGAQVVIVAVIFQDSPFTFWTRKDTGITTPKDFEGRTIGAPPGDSQRVFFPVFAAVNGIDPEKVIWVNMSAGAKIPALAAGQIDIEGNYWGTYPLHVQAIGKDNLGWFRWPEWGVNPYSQALIVHEDFIKERPETLRKFLDATFRGWRWAILHPKEAILMMQKYFPEVDVDLLLECWPYYEDLMDTPITREHGLGWIDKARMEYTIKLVNDIMKPTSPVIAEQAYTTAFLPHYTWPYPEEFPEDYPFPERLRR
ncbi:MAG: ABC transporter substrate-binding protein [Methanomassiliicoccales archaeon]|nr:ABC transporter substrate-binding protein [Methanomassiliicoccales archaeon]